MLNKIENYICENKYLKVIFIIVTIPICSFIASKIFTSGIEFGTFIRKLVDLVKC